MLDANNQMHSSGYFSFSLHRQLNDAMPEYPKKICFSLANELFFSRYPQVLKRGNPMCSMYGIFTNIALKSPKCRYTDTIHGAYGNGTSQS